MRMKATAVCRKPAARDVDFPVFLPHLVCKMPISYTCEPRRFPGMLSRLPIGRERHCLALSLHVVAAITDGRPRCLSAAKEQYIKVAVMR